MCLKVLVGKWLVICICAYVPKRVVVRRRKNVSGMRYSVRQELTVHTVC